MLASLFYQLRDVRASFLTTQISPFFQGSLYKPIKTIGQVIRKQTQTLIEQLLLHSHKLFAQGVNETDVFKQLFAKQAYTMSS